MQHILSVNFSLLCYVYRQLKLMVYVESNLSLLCRFEAAPSSLFASTPENTSDYLDTASAVQMVSISSATVVDTTYLSSFAGMAYVTQVGLALVSMIPIVGIM